MILQRVFLGIQPCFLHIGSHNLLCESQLHFCVMISHMSKVERSVLKQTWCIRLFTNKTLKRNKLSNTWWTVHWITNSMYNRSMVNLPNGSVCWGTWCVNHTRTTGFHHCQSFPLIDDGLTLFSRRFCSSDNCYCFLWITPKLKIKQSATDLS